MTGILAVLTALLALVVAAALSVGAWSRRTGVVPMPSSGASRLAVAEVLRNRGGFDAVVDLGSGWGGMARRLGRELPGTRIVAVELSPWPHRASRALGFLSGAGNVEHVRADFLSMPLAGGTAYVAYLSGPVMKDLRSSFERDRPGGGVLVSVAFAMPGWTPAARAFAGDAYRTPVYAYEF